jgi:hypothetical protein
MPTTLPHPPLPALWRLMASRALLLLVRISLDVNASKHVVKFLTRCSIAVLRLQR